MGGSKTIMGPWTICIALILFHNIVGLPLIDLTLFNRAIIINLSELTTTKMFVHNRQ